jgi:hypothetical protein
VQQCRIPGVLDPLKVIGMNDGQEVGDRGREALRITPGDPVDFLRPEQSIADDVHAPSANTGEALHCRGNGSGYALRLRCRPGVVMA